MNKILLYCAWLLSVIGAFQLQGYVISETQIKYPEENSPEILILGDAHLESKVGKEHFELIKNDLLNRSKKDVSTYVSIEDRSWELIDKKYTSNALRDLTLFAREHNYKMGSVTFGATDCRTLSLISAFYFCGEQYNFKSLCKWANLYSIPTGQQIIGDAYQAIRYAKKALKKIESSILKQHLQILETNLPVIVKAFENNLETRLTDIFYSWYQKDKSGSLFKQFYPYLRAFTNAVAEVGFIIDFLEKKDQFDQIIFYVGHAHAWVIADILASLGEANNIKINSTGPQSRYPKTLSALPTSNIAQTLSLFSSKKRIKKSVQQTTTDVALFVMISVVGLTLFAGAEPRRRYS